MKTFANADYFELVCQLLAQGKCVRLRVQGESMTPFYPDGAFVSLHRPVPGELRKGMPVLARTTNGAVVFHRILRIEGDTFILQGDGNLHGTESAKDEAVFGVAACGIFRRTIAILWQHSIAARRYPLGIWKRLHRLSPAVRRR